MKKCPKCKAEIQEEARFCLYCMTSFEEKQTIKTPKENNKRWLVILAAVLVFVLILIGVFFLPGKEVPTSGESNTFSTTFTGSDLGISNDNNLTSTEQQNIQTKGNKTTSTSGSQTQTSSKNEGTITGGTSGNTTTHNAITGSTSRKSNTSGTTSNSSALGTSSSTSNTTSHTSSNAQPKYTYITATVENTYPTGYSAMFTPENAIVITKVNYKEESGNYIIPDTIDGKKVAAIMPLAFSDASISASVKSVTLPSTVRTIWNDAFKNCYNLTDLYLKSAVIGIYEDAFPLTSMRNEKLTIHCKRDCRDFDFYYYSNIAYYYDAEYEEWNG